MLLHKTVLRQAGPVPSVHLFEKYSQVGSERRALNCERSARAAACQLIDLRGRRTEVKRSCGALPHSTSALGHGDRIGGDRRYRRKSLMSRNFECRVIFGMGRSVPLLSAVFAANGQKLGTGTSMLALTASAGSPIAHCYTGFQRIPDTMTTELTIPSMDCA